MLQKLTFLAFGFAAVCAGPQASAQSLDCGGFREAMAKAAGDLNVDFTRALVVARGDRAGLQQYDLASRARIDGVLRCRGDAFVGFEAKIHSPFEGDLVSRFDKAQEAALVAALKWSQPRAHSRISDLSRDAAEYLRGSAERGDVAVAGKIEEHLPGGVTLGAVWTGNDRTFLLLQED